MSRQTPSLSFEVFPPNPAVGNDNIISALQDMGVDTPHFISVTASNNKFNIKEQRFVWLTLSRMTWRFQLLLASYLSDQGKRLQRHLRTWTRMGYRKSWPCVEILSLMWSKRISAIQRLD